MAKAPLADRGITKREAEVLAALAERLTNAEIAARLYVSERTVESHVASLLRKLDASNRLVLAELSKELLRSRAASALPAALELLADPAKHVGRADELARLRNMWHRSAESRLLACVVTGEAGIGKSRIVAELAREVHAAGARVLLGSCFEDMDVPYQPFVQVVADDLAGLGDAEAHRRLDGTAGALTRVIPDVARRVGVDVSGEVLDVNAAQAEVASGLHRYLSRAADAGPILLVVEDVHWATATTLGAMIHLARVGGHVPLLVVITARDVAPDLRDSLKVFLGDLLRLPTVESIGLKGLHEGDVAKLLDTLGTSDDPAAVHAETGGNPLFVTEVARAKDSRTGGWSLEGLLARRYSLLADDDLAILDVASVIGSEFDAELVAKASSRPLTDVLEALERSEDAGIVAAEPGRPSHNSFVHSLFRRARYDSIPGARRLILHRGVAAGLEAMAERNEQLLPELARHACIAAPVGDPRRAVEHAVAAAAFAERSLALEEASGHCRRALEVAEALCDAKLVLSLTIRLGELLHGAGDPQARELLLRAAETARAMGDGQALAAVSWALIRHGAARRAGGDPEFVGIVEDALASLGPARTAVRARTLSVLSEDLTYTDPARALDVAHEAIAIAEELDDPVTLGHVLLPYRISGKTPDNDGEETADRLIAIGRQTGHEPFVFLGFIHRAWSLRGAGDLRGSERAMETAAALLGDRPAPFYAALFAQWRSAQKLMAGDLEAAEDSANEILGIVGPEIDVLTMYGPALVMIRSLQGRLPELIGLIEPAADAPGVGTAYRSVLGVAYAFDGRLGDARKILERSAACSFGDVPRNLMWLTAMVCFGEIAEIAADAGAAATIASELEAYSGRIADLPVAVVSPIDLSLAQMALTLGDHERAERFAVKAIGASRSRKTPIFLGRELIRLAAARSRLGAPGAKVDRLVDEALAISERTGAHLVRQEADRYGLLA